MKSLRFYLITSVLSAMTLLIFLSGLQGYHKTVQATKFLLDQQLVDNAKMLSSLQTSANNPYLNLTHNESTAFQIWHQNTLVARSPNAPNTPIIALASSIQDRNFNQHRWRCYAHYNAQNDYWVITASRLDLRNQLVDQIILQSVLPTMFILPTALIAIWLLVGHGLKPIQQLATQLQAKQAHDLEPIELEHTIQELKPLTRSTNALLLRLQNALEREKCFSADAAHELRTPISILKVYAHNLAKELPENNQNFHHLKQGIHRMEHLVEQILALYRTAPDQYSTQLQPLDVYAVAQCCIANQYVQFEAKAQNIELRGVSATLLGDDFSLTTLIENLLSNANKYTPEHGNIVILVHKNSHHVSLRIEDDGPGIPAEFRQRIFDRFYRLDGDQHQSGATGCGLGLSIVQHIVSLHQGYIRLEQSQFKTGLAVVIEFPVSPEETTSC